MLERALHVNELLPAVPRDGAPPGWKARTLHTPLDLSNVRWTVQAERLDLCVPCAQERPWTTFLAAGWTSDRAQEECAACHHGQRHSAAPFARLRPSALSQADVLVAVQLRNEHYAVSPIACDAVLWQGQQRAVTAGRYRVRLGHGTLLEREDGRRFAFQVDRDLRHSVVGSIALLVWRRPISRETVPVPVQQWPRSTHAEARRLQDVAAAVADELINLPRPASIVCTASPARSAGAHCR